jgi:hypothetical protein
MKYLVLTAATALALASTAANAASLTTTQIEGVAAIRFCMKYAPSLVSDTSRRNAEALPVIWPYEVPAVEAAEDRLKQDLDRSFANDKTAYSFLCMRMKELGGL